MITRVSIPITCGIATPHCSAERWRYIEMTLSSLERNSAYEHDVILVSETPAAEIPAGRFFDIVARRWPWVQLVDASALYRRILARTDVTQPRMPVYEMLNYGALHACEEWIVTLWGDDTYCPPDWDAKLLGQVDPKRSGAAWLPVFAGTRHDPSQPMGLRKDGCEWRLNHAESTIRESDLVRALAPALREGTVEEPMGYHVATGYPYMVLRRDDYFAAGGFDEHLESGADQAFERKLAGHVPTKVGVEAVFVCNSHVHVRLGE